MMEVKLISSAGRSFRDDFVGLQDLHAGVAVSISEFHIRAKESGRKRSRPVSSQRRFAQP